MAMLDRGLVDVIYTIEFQDCGAPPKERAGAYLKELFCEVIRENPVGCDSVTVIGRLYYDDGSIEVHDFEFALPQNEGGGG